ncbi:MAG: RagB/SusD family nutrient uptake outer membrane protein, partial [Duncaniella sp.]|nr:RagB/SusD family nutrient uptake outer membrane protein [Duncaniella sp.]
MNKINKYLLVSLVAGVSFTSCNDLDTAPFGDVITEDQRTEVIGNNPEKLEATISAMYASLNAWESASENMFDFGYPAVMIQMDSRTEDFLTSNPDMYGWFSACVAWQDNAASSAYGICRWRIPYNSIYTANQVIEIVGALDPDKEDDIYRFYRAQALGARAFNYWVLAQLFQFNYVGHEQSPCVPLITEENQADIAINGAPRATVAEIYTQIINDLTEGIQLTTGNPMARADKRYIDNSVLYALRARAYLCMQKYAEAAADAQKVIDSGRFSALTAAQASVPGFSELSSSNWIWGVNMDETDVHGLYTFSGMMGSYTYGYAYAGMWKLINSNLFARIPANDVRRTWWIDENGNSNAVNYTAASSDAVAYLESIGAPTYAVTKFAAYQNVLQQSNNAADIPLIRIE